MTEFYRRLLPCLCAVSLVGTQLPEANAAPTEPNQFATQQLAPASNVPHLKDVGQSEAGLSPSATSSRDAASSVSLVSAEDDLAAETSSAVLENKQEEVAAELRVAMLQEKQEAESSGNDNDQPSADSSRVDLLKQIDVVIAQQQSATSSNEDHDAQVASLKQLLTRLADGKIEDRTPPYSIVYQDGLKESVRNANTRLLSAESSVVSARNAAETAKLELDDRAKTLRQRKENSTPATESEIQIAELEQKLAEEMLVLRRQELSIAEANQAIAKLQLEIEEKKLAIVGDSIVFTREMLEQKLDDFDLREIELKQQVARLKNELHFAERRWMAARQETDSTPNAGPELTERVDSLKVAQMTLQNHSSLINQQLQRIPILKKAWERRFVEDGIASGVLERGFVNQRRQVVLVRQFQRPVELVSPPCRQLQRTASVEAGRARIGDRRRLGFAGRFVDVLPFGGEEVKVAHRVPSVSVMKVPLETPGVGGRRRVDLIRQLPNDVFLSILRH